MAWRIPLYHCCSSFLSKCVDFCSSANCSCESLDCLSRVSCQHVCDPQSGLWWLRHIHQPGSYEGIVLVTRGS
jgi:hypothetical protein